jgi:hypothetical protein
LRPTQRLTATVRVEVLVLPDLSVAFTVTTARACWPGLSSWRNALCSAVPRRSVSVRVPEASFAVARVSPSAVEVPGIVTEPVAESEQGLLRGGQRVSSGIVSIFIFISGAALLIYSAERLIGYIVGAASGLSVSVFLLAIIFTGIEFDDVALGVALNLEELSGVALGIVFGSALSLSGVVLALAAILAPTEVNVPRDYIAIFAASPLVLIVFMLTAPLTAIHGVVLLGLFVLFVAYVAVRESRSHAPVFRDAKMHRRMAEEDGGGELTGEKTGQPASAEKPLVNTMAEANGGRELTGDGAGQSVSAAMPFAAVVSSRCRRRQTSKSLKESRSNSARRLKAAVAAWCPWLPASYS